MVYKNGKEVLPADLLAKIQEYVQGELVYIPKKIEKRAGWGELNGSKDVFAKRNREIYHRYLCGSSIEELINLYNLSEESLRKIITKTSYG